MNVKYGLALEKYNKIDYFFSLSAEEQQQIIDHTHTKKGFLVNIKNQVSSNRFSYRKSGHLIF